MSGEGAIQGTGDQWSTEAVSGVAFTTQQLYVLLGGTDYGRFAVLPSQATMDSVGNDSVLNNMRRDMAASLSPLGLVDDQGEPCRALAYLLDPIRDCRFDVMDGRIPGGGDLDDAEAADMRTFCVCFGRSSATMMCHVFAADQPGIALLDLGAPDGWGAAFVHRTHLDTIWQYADEPMRVECDNQRELDSAEAMMRGDSSSASNFASGRKGGERLIALADGRRRTMKPNLRMGWMVSHDYRRTSGLAGSPQLRDMRIGPEPKVVTQIIPEAGAMFCRQTVSGSDLDESVWGSGGNEGTRGVFEFVASGSVLERLLGIPQSQWGEGAASAREGDIAASEALDGGWA
ncbi:hypothetical protein OZX62_07405 [Bifidobacterium sp. ESL0690]|uniref:hypothetical protein n=1 Tax=Bifidobacterium sp. ESL0690 TaxID=2983214 RepID=UPI0023FA09A5|nr:hypothetical protein [Bifidobacterium sp. ESL0690]WEV46264.1 hypothetical protein OZX62_07405 [Bifidobacterium sp. ESL0690]